MAGALQLMTEVFLSKIWYSDAVKQNMSDRILGIKLSIMASVV
jgi:hypothetical protein